MKEWIMLNIMLAVLAAVVAYCVILPIVDKLLYEMGL